MYLYVHLTDGNFVTLSNVDTIVRIDPFKTFVVHGIIFDYSIVEYVCYLNESAPLGHQHIIIFDNGRFKSSRYDIMKYEQPIKEVEGVAIRAE